MIFSHVQVVKHRKVLCAVGGVVEEVGTDILVE